MDYDKVIAEITDTIAQRRLDEYLGGAMIPSGSLQMAEVLAIVYSKSEKDILKDMESVAEKKFDEAWEAHLKEYHRQVEEMK